MLEAATFDVVLMDIQMPIMGGVEALEKIREKESSASSHLPVIAVTAHAFRDDENLFLHTGFDGYISKPFNIDTLFSEIYGVLGRLNR